MSKYFQKNTNIFKLFLFLLKSSVLSTNIENKHNHNNGIQEKYNNYIVSESHDSSKIIESKNLDILKQPRELLMEIFKDGFNQEKFIDFKSSRMTLIQLY